MGWGRQLLLDDFGNPLDSQDVERELQTLKKVVRNSFRQDMSQDDMIELLLKQNAELKLYLAGLVRLLGADQVIDLKELEALVELIDGEDGKVDGVYEGDIL